ncbi:MAG: DUF4365 domain-containing protein [Saprospiraceae bacterium]
MRKTRTRQHIIEDLGFNHTERFILKAGFTVQRYDRNDYGYDGIVHTFNSTGEIESFSILFQLKSTDGIRWVESRAGFGLDISVRDLELWLSGVLPVLVILYDASLEKAYFIDLQEYLQTHRKQLQSVRKFVRIHFHPENQFGTDSIQKIREKYFF